MQYDVLTLYLLTLNFAAFVLGGAASRRRSAAMDGVLRFLSAAGGAAGLLGSWLLWDRHVNKNNVMSRFSALCYLLVQLLLLLALRGRNAAAVRLYAEVFASSHRTLLLYLTAINLLTLLLFLWDKLSALRSGERIPEAVLLFAALFGGSAGALLGMDLFRHKTQSAHFLFGVPMALALNLLGLLSLLVGVF